MDGKPPTVNQKILDYQRPIAEAKFTTEMFVNDEQVDEESTSTQVSTSVKTAQVSVIATDEFSTDTNSVTPFSFCQGRIYENH